MLYFTGEALEDDESVSVFNLKDGDQLKIDCSCNAQTTRYTVSVLTLSLSILLVVLQFEEEELEEGDEEVCASTFSQTLYLTQNIHTELGRAALTAQHCSFHLLFLCHRNKMKRVMKMMMMEILTPRSVCIIHKFFNVCTFSFKLHSDDLS